MKWIVQNNFRTDAEDTNKIKSACEKFDLLFEGVKVVPFSNDIYEVDLSVPAIFYGGTGWINKIYEKYKPLGIFFNPESVFTYWIEKYKENALNYGAKQTTLEELSQENRPDNEPLFVRPVKDLKEFNGGVMYFRDIRDWANKIYCVAENYGKIPIVAGEPYRISREWRLFILEGKVITGSQYRLYSILNVKPEVPQEVVDFAEEQAKVFSPTPAFVMDIGESNKNLYVIEIGCLNSAGFYASNIDKIVCEVSNYLEKIWK
jgi:hypothetical protein